mgnify:CR=1 FL=1
MMKPTKHLTKQVTNNNPRTSHKKRKIPWRNVWWRLKALKSTTRGSYKQSTILPLRCSSNMDSVWCTPRPKWKHGMRTIWIHLLTLASSTIKRPKMFLIKSTISKINQKWTSFMSIKSGLFWEEALDLRIISMLRVSIKTTVWHLRNFMTCSSRMLTNLLQICGWRNLTKMWLQAWEVLSCGDLSLWTNL